jgi:hypothetical protein
MVDVDLKAIARSLYLRRGSGIMVPLEARETDGWKPSPRYCHINSDRYAMENVGHQPLRGWFVFDYSDIGRCHFLAHSIVEDSDGKLFDLTPSPAPRPPFLRHEGLEGEFEAIVLAGHSTLIHVIEAQ